VFASPSVSSLAVPVKRTASTPKKKAVINFRKRYESEEEMRQYSKEEKAKWLEDWRQSGKKAWLYAKENGLVPQTFNSWTKAGKALKQPFVEVPRHILQTPRLEYVTIEKGGMKLLIPVETVITELRTVIASIGQPA
jgi:hypothetical protein